MQKTSKKVAIVQSNYIPWKGYFDMIHTVDEFILFDAVQYTRRDWRNRNKIKTSHGTAWLTIPVAVKGKYTQRICETVISERDWNLKHWKTICHAYSTARFFRDYRNLFQCLFLDATFECLSEINLHFIKAICGLLGIQTKISWSSDYELIEGRSERLAHLCQQAHATEYVSGPAAQAYLESSPFDQRNIAVSYMNYKNYPEYRQLFPPFEHAVSILDLIFNEGSRAGEYMHSFKQTVAVPADEAATAAGPTPAPAKEMQ